MSAKMERKPFKPRYCPRIKKLCITEECVAFERFEGAFSVPENNPTMYYYKCKHFDVPLGFKDIP